MRVKYLPDTYDKKKVEENGWTEEQFLLLQEKYREEFINKLLNRIDVDKIKEILGKGLFPIPIIEDQEYNFYHKSIIINQYLYLRNNIHIEKLTKEEIEEMYSAVLVDKNLSEEFIKHTAERVLYEEGDYTYYGMPSDKTVAPSRSIVVEFAYNQLKCNSIEQIVYIKDCYKEITKSLNETSKNSEIPIVTMLDNGIIQNFKPVEETILIK